MLILSRRTGDQIVIDGKIRVVVTAIRGRVVKLGIIAPSNIPVHRYEVYERLPGFEGPQAFQLVDASLESSTP